MTAITYPRAVVDWARDMCQNHSDLLEALDELIEEKEVVVNDG